MNWYCFPYRDPIFYMVCYLKIQKRLLILFFNDYFMMIRTNITFYYTKSKFNTENVNLRMEVAVFLKIGGITE